MLNFRDMLRDWKGCLRKPPVSPSTYSMCDNGPTFHHTLFPL